MVVQTDVISLVGSGGGGVIVRVNIGRVRTCLSTTSGL